MSLLQTYGLSWCGHLGGRVIGCVSCALTQADARIEELEREVERLKRGIDEGERTLFEFAPPSKDPVHVVAQILKDSERELSPEQVKRARARLSEIAEGGAVLEAPNLADWAERIQREAVAERDKEWQASIGISTFSGPNDIRPAFEEVKQHWVDQAVAEEREALREIVERCAPCTGICSSVREELDAALDAREKASE